MIGFILSRLLLILFLTISALCGLWMWSGPRAWDIRIASRDGALRLLVPLRLTELTLELGDGYEPGGASFLVADTAAAVREFWAYRNLKDIRAGAVHPCADKTPCRHQGRSLRLTLPPAQPRSGDPRESYLREVFLIATHPQTASPALSLALLPALRVLSVSWIPKGGDGASADRCATATQMAQDRCLTADVLLGHPTIVNLHDLQPAVVRVARWSTANLVPAIILSMLVGDGLLVLLLLTLFAMNLVGGRLADRVRRLCVRPSVTVHGQNLHRGLRRALEWAEVTGPAMGFLLTVGSLLLAFDPAIFNDRDTGRFTEAISLAMVATFAGLLMRIASFSADRLIEHLIDQGADPHGFVHSSAEQEAPR